MSKDNKKGFFNKPYNKFFKSKTEEKDKQDIKNITETVAQDMHDSEIQNNMAEEEAYKPVNRHDNLSSVEKQEKNEIYVNGIISDSCPSGLNFRKEPYLSSDVIKVLFPGDEIQFVDNGSNSNWCKVKKDGNIGYCMAQYIIKAEPTYI